MAMLVMANAANMAYLKAIKKTRNKDYLAQNHPYWMQYFADNLPERIAPPQKLLETRNHRKKRIMANSNNKYNRLAWFIYSKIISRVWFDAFVLINILAIGAVTGLDLESDDHNQDTKQVIQVVSAITSAVFTVEAVLKIVAEGPEPLRYFTDPENGKFNTLDFFIVTAGYGLIGVESGSAVGVLRMLRLVRLLTFIKGVPQLRAILQGLAKGVSSVSFIVMLLILIIYLFGIIGVLMFGENDPVRFGTVPMAMISLFQVSTLASWTSIAYTSWFGCGNYNGDPYLEDSPSRIHTLSGDFIGFQCNQVIENPTSTFFFFSLFIVIASWVVMSLFIGVISMEMFEAFNELKDQQKEQLYRNKLEENQEIDLDEGRQQKNATLKEKIEYALDEEIHVYTPTSKCEYYLIQLVEVCIQIRDSKWFTSVVVLTIIVVGFMLGIDSDALKKCERRKFRESQDKHQEACESLFSTMVVNWVALGVFAVEALVKIIAEGSKPLHYFTDPQNGSWNKLDFFIVVIGFVEVSGVSFLDFFPVVLLRLLRLLRVLRLTKAFPGLRSIVDALLSGLTSVGWICVLLVVFNYIAGCFCILIFGENDPVHFGSVGRAMFTVFRMETLDNWDQVFKIAFYGCEEYPNGYELLITNVKDMQCHHSKGYGYYGAMFLYCVVLFGAYILPTVLVGIVSINFNIATHRTAALDKMKQEMSSIENMAKEALPDFFNSDRLEAIRAVFETMDADEELTLDLNEMTPFYHFVFDFVFNIELEESQIEALFHLMDCDGDSELGFEEFLRFLVTIKQLDVRCRNDPEYKKLAFPPDIMKAVEGAGPQDTWKRSMKKMDRDAITKAWNRILDLNHFDEGENLESQIRVLFDHFDSDGSNGLDYEELTVGLNSLGILINARQIELMTLGMDKDGNGVIECEEFCRELDRRRVLRLKEFEETAHKEALDTLNSLKHLMDGNTSGSSLDNPKILYPNSEPSTTFDSTTFDTGNSGATSGGGGGGGGGGGVPTTLSRQPSYKRRNVSNEDHYAPVEFTQSLQRMKSGVYKSRNNDIYSEDECKSLDDLMEECIGDMTTTYYVDAFKKKSKTIRDDDLHETMSTRHVSPEQYAALSLLLKDRIQSTFEEWLFATPSLTMEELPPSPPVHVPWSEGIRPSTPPRRPP